MSKNKITILYPYFFPGYKAGGITQSLYNLALQLKDKYEIQVVCYNYDLGDNKPYSFIKNDDFQERNADGFVVAYLGKQNFNKNAKIIINKFNPKYLYVSSIYDITFLLLGLKLAKSNRKLVIAPRGMLQKGALQQKKLKKLIFLFGLKYFLGKKTIWHATDNQEKLDIKTWFGENASISVAIDTPRPLPQYVEIPEKKENELKLVYYSLITEKKNLSLLLEALALVDFSVSLDIYGPNVDELYWKKCEKAIQEMRENVVVKYCGKTTFDEFSKVSSKYQFFILPTRGENFGHVIYESLTLGLPVIISKFTPWKFKEGSIGFYVDLNATEIAKKLKEMSDIESNYFKKLSQESILYAKNYYNVTLKKLNSEYAEIFKSDE